MAAAAPFAMKVAPYAISALGGLFGRKASGPSRQQQTAMAGAQQASDALTGTSASLLGEGKSLRGTGTEYLRQGAGYLGQGAGQVGRGAGYVSRGARELEAPASYYRNILGSRQAAQQALAPETTTALEYYRGAEGKSRRTLQGGARDEALAELDRQKVGQLAGFLPAARRTAAEGATGVGRAYGDLAGTSGALGNIYGGLGSAAGNLGGTAMQGGTSLTGQGVNAAQTNAYLQSGLFDMASRLRDQEGAGGKAWGGFMFDIVSSLLSGKGKSTAGLPSRGPTPAMIRAGATLPSVSTGYR